MKRGAALEIRRGAPILSGGAGVPVDNPSFRFQRFLYPVAAVLLIAHAPLASALLSVARHVYADQAGHIEGVDVDASMSADAAEALAREALARLADPEVLILTDVFGATPCNVAQKLADGEHVRVVTGVNVPMLWRSLCYLREPLEALATRAVAGAAQGVMQVAVNSPQNQSLNSSHDPNHSRHQQ